eukprot:TRINITY_DN44264_c0_g1_i1.p1 TRINITY_DN44264_c0_g1~~TRINITY_DN44264_c0_g1_i1.p1  ORF type:complete len:180 (+),score=7.26 TRINITY_DN44264_c0_g1_i1:112-651(+)
MFSLHRQVFSFTAPLFCPLCHPGNKPSLDAVKEGTGPTTTASSSAAAKASPGISNAPSQSPPAAEATPVKNAAGSTGTNSSSSEAKMNTKAGETAKPSGASTAESANVQRPRNFRELLRALPRAAIGTWYGRAYLMCMFVLFLPTHTQMRWYIEFRCWVHEMYYRLSGQPRLVNPKCPL